MHNPYKRQKENYPGNDTRYSGIPPKQGHAFAYGFDA